MRAGHFAFLSLALNVYLSNVADALVDPDRTGTVAENEYVDPTFNFTSTTFSTSNATYLPADLASRLENLEKKFNITTGSTHVDDRSGRVVNLFVADPIIPGDGVGNNLGRANSPGSSNNEDWSEMAVQAVQNWLYENEENLDVVVSQLFATGNTRTAVHGADGDMIQLNMPRTFKGISVKGSHASASVKAGNLISIGFETWGTIPSTFSVNPTTTSNDAKDALAVQADRALNLNADDKCSPELQILTLINEEEGIGNGYDHALAWKVCPEFIGQDTEVMEGYVDAVTEQIYSFVDAVDYFEAKGSVYPITNNGVAPFGVQTVAPMKFMEVGLEITDTGGNFLTGGLQTARYEGPFVKMWDQCGPASLPQTGGIDWGSHSGTDCTTPGFGGPGNTHASRTGFYELNSIMEIARSRLPNNVWLQGQFLSIMNINNNCNAFFSAPNTIGFFTSGGGCANTGEIAHVFDHEWGHGMDYNDVSLGVSSPSGEGIADIYAALRLGDSCIGENFLTIKCTAGGDPCDSCTGVRDIDYEKHQSKSPHTFTWMLSNCGSSKHCKGHIYSEAIWSLYKRVLPQMYNYDDNTSLEIVTRLTYIAAGNVQTWFAGTAPFAGCGSNSGYLSFIAADDDDGNMNNGTPHMKAIFKAFNDQEIACNFPNVQDSGCATSPNTAPVITATPSDKSVVVTWTNVGAAIYQIFRAEGAMRCAQGKVLVGETSLLTFSDTDLQNGYEYHYIIVPKGSNAACFGPASSCESAIPVVNIPQLGKWYVRWGTETCVQDCEPVAGSCGGLAEPWEFLFDTETMCCQIKLSYKHLGWCEVNSNANPYDGSGEWYIDHINKKCVKDCAIGGLSDGNNDCGGIIEDAWVNLYGTSGDCCQQELPWVNKDLCMDASDPSSTGTNKYYANFPAAMCLRDCDTGPFGCVRVPDATKTLYDTIDDCCRMSQSWVDDEYCASRSIGSYSDGWVVDSSNEKCVQDCAPGSAPTCAQPEHNDPSATIYSSPTVCCQMKLNWIDVNKCAGDSQGIPYHTNKFYADYSSNKCAKDCVPPAINPLPCMGNPKDSTTQTFLTAQDCCQTKFGWLNLDQCVADTNGVAPIGSSQWYVDSNISKCVKDCVGAAPCGGMKENWETPHPTRDGCCATISWVPSNICSL